MSPGFVDACWGSLLNLQSWGHLVREGATVRNRSHSGFQPERHPLSDKSPRQSKSQKTTKSIKEKRADKRSKASGESFSDTTSSSKKK